MYSFIKDTGLVLKRTVLKGDNCFYTIFSNTHGKLVLFSFGTRKITSRRISHLQTGNLISFVASRRGNFLHMGDTELIDGFSAVRSYDYKIDHMLTSFFVLDKVLAEEQRESSIFFKTVECLRSLEEVVGAVEGEQVFDVYLRSILRETGFITMSQVTLPSFQPLQFIEQLTERRIKRIIGT